MVETVFITGADKGLGFALAERFLRAGLHVFAGVHSSAANFSELLREFPNTLSVLSLDVTRMDLIHAAAASVAKEVSALDILINNAAVHLEKEITPLDELDCTDQHLRKTMAVSTFRP